MNIWIRSQNRQELVKAKKLYIVHSDSGLCDYIRDEEGYLAKYTKEGRALEVLDEIQNLISEDEYMHISQTKIYEMPKE